MAVTEAPPPVRYAIPLKRLPALETRYGGPCEGIGARVPTEDGPGYRSVVCGELGLGVVQVVVDPVTGRLRVRPVG